MWNVLCEEMLWSNGLQCTEDPFGLTYELIRGNGQKFYYLTKG